MLGHPDQVEAGATGGKRIHLKQNKRHRFIEYTSRDEQTRQQKRDCLSVSSGRKLYLRGNVRRLWDPMEFSFLGTCVQV